MVRSIYNGPQGAYVPKSFSGGRRTSALTDLGFIVVQMDAMGTAFRSKAFHDVCWHNLKDAGIFPTDSLAQGCRKRKNIPIMTSRAMVFTAHPPADKTPPPPSFFTLSFIKSPSPIAAATTTASTNPPGTNNGWVIPSARNTRKIPTSKTRRSCAENSFLSSAKWIATSRRNPPCDLSMP